MPIQWDDEQSQSITTDPGSLPSKLMGILKDFPIGATVGGTIGGIGAGALGSVVPGAGTLAGAVAGSAGGSALGQMVEDYLREGALNPRKDIMAGALGAAGPVAGRVVRGAGLAGMALARRSGLLGDLFEAAAKTGDQIPMGPLAEAATSLENRVGGTVPSAGMRRMKSAVDYVEKALTGPEAQLSGESVSLPIDKVGDVRRNIGQLFNEPARNMPELSKLYRGIGDSLRQASEAGSEGASLMNRGLAEESAYNAFNIMPNSFLQTLRLLGTIGIGGAATYAGTQNPFASLVTGIGFPIAAKLATQTAANPFLDAGITAAALQGLRAVR